ncbi:TlpA family protein disulfide reductase [Brevibacillus panacihumi]|uniref:TlpA family protein disulfide reductase n=1 Tax=Brevibacillus panacihumi TaxID=497735 RepID=A0A3M8CGZ1_9BACL|nr:TlpA disulfide reductase family protein [Brevibacillus panacihumi]RNB74085.1 TlpA family protein disulfide reductase [Brevibacillus panacihumi]
MKRLVLAMLLAVGLGYVIVGQQSVQVMAQDQKPEVGYQAPHFTLTGLNNQQYRVAGKREKPLIINFWASWCGPCKMEAPDLQKIHEMYGKKVDLYGVNVTSNDNPEAAMQFVQSYKLTFPIPMDVTGSVSDRYKIMAFPTTYLVDREGIVRQKIIGMIDAKTLEKELQKLLAD